MELKSITFQHRDFELDFDGVFINKDYVKVRFLGKQCSLYVHIQA